MTDHHEVTVLFSSREECGELLDVYLNAEAEARERVLDFDRTLDRINALPNPAKVPSPVFLNIRREWPSRASTSPKREIVLVAR